MNRLVLQVINFLLVVFRYITDNVWTVIATWTHISTGKGSFPASAFVVAACVFLQPQVTGLPFRRKCSNPGAYNTSTYSKGLYCNRYLWPS